MAKIPPRTTGVYVDDEPVINQRVLPYRGVETHGVALTGQVDVNPNEADYGTTVGVVLEPPEKHPDPVPVVIVSEDTGAGALKTWRVVREYARAATPRRILGQDDTRTSVKVRNLHATDTLYVGPDTFVTISQGYPIPPGTEFSLSDAVTTIWALTGSTNDIDIAILVEFTIAA
jgi:hypothetical protein